MHNRRQENYGSLFNKLRIDDDLVRHVQLAVVKRGRAKLDVRLTALDHVGIRARRRARASPVGASR